MLPDEMMVATAFDVRR